MLSLHKENRERLSSLPYQILLTVHVWYYIIFIFIGEISIFIYKGVVLPYPNSSFVLEIILILFTSGVEAVRNFMGQKGNLTEQTEFILLSLGLTLPLTFGFLYFLLWQTYVLRIEVITHAVQLTLLALETLFALLTVASLAKYGNFTIRR